ncbi:MAG: CocE/NonD family hydrolase [Actinobacteria bacterium]|jgi:putative CocE/NonD family hydrolase|nr:CocE/NonD family hydrolase [Actinomycetota bacterium]
MDARSSTDAIAGKRVDRSILLENCRVPMRDGRTLATDVYLPAHGSGPWPVIVERTPYHRERTILVRAAHYFSRHGYAFALQDVRGRYDSDGDWDFGVNEAEDGYDTVEWLASQPWSDGRVATTGLSYSNSTQSSLATLRPEALVTQFRCQGQSSYYVSGLRMVGGALDGRMYPFMLHMALSDPRARADAQLTQRIEAHLAHDRLMPILLRGTIDAGTTVLAEFPDYERSLLDTLTRGGFDDHWRNRTLSPQEYYDDVPDVPMMLVGSWYDMHTKGTLNDYVELRRRLSQPIHLIMGPWLHGEEPVRHSFSGDTEFGGAAAFDYNDERRRWFDHVLRGIDSGLQDEPPVKLFVMGGGSGRRRMDAPTPTHRLDHGGTWRWEQEWPLARMQPTPYYLHAGGALTADASTGTESITYRFDPRNPVPSVGGAMSGVSSVARPGGLDQRDPTSGLPLEQRADVLVFRTAPLEVDTELTGPVLATLFVSSDAPDTDFTVKLIDEYPPSPDWPEGFSLNICDGIIRSRFHEGFDHEAMLEPGEIYRLEVDLSATSNLFVRGHRIRIDVSSSNFPKYDVNPNTGEPLGRQRSSRPANNTVHLSADHPSQVLLPVIPAS